MSKEHVEKYKKERDEYLEGWKRAKADFLNYKKEEGERLKRARDGGEMAVMEELMSIVDNFDKSLEHGKETVERKGVLLIRKQLATLLKSHGIAEFVPKTGEPFDPRRHEAIAVADSKEKEGTIVSVVRAGYENDHIVVRPAQVIVAK